MPRALPPPRRAARGGSAPAVAALLLAVGLAGCSSSSAESTCNDISGAICEKLAGCGALTPTFTSPEQCTASFNGFFEVGGSDDAACRDEWAQAEPLDCVAFVNRYRL